MPKNTQYEVEALVYIKYNDTPYKIGDRFEIKADDVKELESKGYIKKLKAAKQKKESDEKQDDEKKNDGEGEE